jgi:(1->4)-alpha-D-glucan 1-alpha-D-glucosylmutase
VRLAALNEVGGDPAHVGTPVAEFHRQNARRAAHHPHAMLATATHDNKRGEDVRARIAAISEVPVEWRRALARWTRLNRKHRGGVSRLAEYVMYQTILGAWPTALLAGEMDAAALASFVERIVAYAVKAAREAKLRTSWTNPDGGYESALEDFVRAILDPQRAPEFFASVRNGARSLAATAVTNSLAQIVLKVTVPGVPDTYQGTELWDLSLVDPDNRRPVDFAARSAVLRALDDALRDGMPRDVLARELLAAWPDGRIKLYVLATLLRHRAAAEPAAWPDAAYAPLDALGERFAHVVAFARGSAIAIVPRLPRTLSGEHPPLGEAVWGTTSLALGANGASRYRDVLTGRVVTAVARDGRRVLPLADALAVLPVAVLEAVAEAR